MKKNKIDVHNGFGSLKSATEVVVESEDGNKTLTAKNIILATGSVPRHLPFLKVDGKHVVSSDEILELKTPPKSLIVLGAGAVGMEFASIYSRFGTKCTVVEMLDRVLPLEDREVSEEMAKCYKKRGIDVMTSTKLESAQVKGGEVTCQLDTGSKKVELKAEMILVAVGRVPVTSKFGLDKAGVQADDAGYIAVDPYMRTSVPGFMPLVTLFEHLFWLTLQVPKRFWPRTTSPVKSLSHWITISIQIAPTPTLKLQASG